MTNRMFNLTLARPVLFRPWLIGTWSIAIEERLGVGKTRCIARFPCDSTAVVTNGVPARDRKLIASWVKSRHILPWGVSILPVMRVGIVYLPARHQHAKFAGQSAPSGTDDIRVHFVRRWTTSDKLYPDSRIALSDPQQPISESISWLTCLKILGEMQQWVYQTTSVSCNMLSMSRMTKSKALVYQRSNWWVTQKSSCLCFASTDDIFST